MGLFDQIKRDLENAFGNPSSQGLLLVNQTKKLKLDLQTHQAYLNNTEQSFMNREIDEVTYNLLKQKYGDEVKMAQDKLKLIKIEFRAKKHQTEQRIISNKGEVILLEKDMDQSMSLYEKGLIPENEYNKKTNFLPTKIQQLQQQIRKDQKTLEELESVKEIFEEIEE